MQGLLPWERLLWHRRAWWPPRAEYALTDVRLLCREGDASRDVALSDIIDVQRVRTLADRLIGTSTLIVHSRYERQTPLTLRHVRRGASLAALLDLLAGDAGATIDEAGVEAALTWTPRTGRTRTGEVIGALLVVTAAIVAVSMGLQGEAASIAYPTDDAIYPRGAKRDREAIVRFMETAVLPWARGAMAPIVGGADRVTCGTCHGPDAQRRGWRMPGVAALPEPHIRPVGSNADADTVDAQVRNAIYGYLAESDNQARAAYMREVVVPGIARLLGRPAYDFTKTYEYNRTRFAIGCYHCHRAGESGPASAAASRTTAR